MKKILLTFLILFSSFNVAYAQKTVPVDFIYINGSNTNDQKAYENFKNGISNFHPTLKKRIETDSFTYEHILKNGNYVISDTPSHYFWGYRSQEDLAVMREKAKLLQSVSPLVAYAVRNMLAGMLHDAIWVRNTNNMIPILNELHIQVKDDINAGKKVVLLGYSAGTFITMEYLSARMAYINFGYWISVKQKQDKDFIKFVQNNPRKQTCPAALFNSGILTITPMGEVQINENKTRLKEAYLNLDKYTECECVPENSILGVINYASPIPLFYSDISNPKYDVNKFLKLMYKHVIEHDMFFLTVNFADDPLGYPNDVNYKNSEIAKYLNVDFEHEKGFFYDYSKDLSWRTVINAHTCYWKAKERFAKAIVKGYKEGYQYQYSK